MYSSLLSLVFVTETWLSGSFFDNEILPTGYSIFRKDRHSQGGGVLIAVASHILSSFIYSQSYPDILIVKLLSPSPVILCVVYIPPLSLILRGHHYWTIYAVFLLHLVSQLLFWVILIAKI